MKIATFNINNVRKRLPNLLEWLRGANPDVVCLQELKTEDAQFPADVIRQAGYESVWKGQKSWNGVAILARGATPIVTRTELPGDPADEQSRYIEAAVNGAAGLRLDQILLSSELAERLVAVGVERAVRGEDNASDHAPVWAEIRDPTKSRAAVARKAQLRPAARSKAAVPSGPMATERRPLLVIDGDSFAHRAYHALPKRILRKGKRPAGAILGFANLLLRFYQAERPRAVLVGWDTLDEPTYRNEQFPAYQSGREFDDALVEQLNALPELVAACGFANAKAPGYEADDFLAAAVAREEKRGGTVLVASGDRDAFQLASERTTILFPVRAGEVARITPAEVQARYGVGPRQVPDFIALRGDPSDKLPGARNIGAQGAADLLRRHGTLEALLKTGRFATQAKELRLYRAIATMDRKAPMPRLPDQKPSWERAAALARTWGLDQLAGRLGALATKAGTHSR